MMAGSALAPSSEFADGDYQIIRPLDSGGQGAVYVALQKATGHERALKLMRSQLMTDPKMRKLFEQEARIGSQIESDHVVQVVDAGVDRATDVPWLAMELLKGQVLSKRIEGHQTLSMADLQTLYRQICHALAAAHSKNIVHRDLKPENIFLAEPRQTGLPFVAKILDFGIAKIVADNATPESRAMGMGTPEWAAPEQYDRETRITPATDVWALGLIAFRLLTGYHYHRTANLTPIPQTPILRDVVLEPLVAASERAKEYGVADRLPAGFDAWFRRCVVRELEQRFKDAGEAYTAFETLGRGDFAVAPGRPPAPTPPRPIGVPGLFAPHKPAAEPAPVIGASVNRPSDARLQPAPPPPALAPRLAAALAVMTLLAISVWAIPRIREAGTRKLCRAEEGSTSAAVEAQASACQSACASSGAQYCIRRGDLLLGNQSSGADRAAQALRAYQEACDRGQLEGCRKQAALLGRGGPGLASDPRQAAQQWERLCSRPDQEACAEEGALLLALNDEQALPRLEQACKAAVTRACELIEQYRDKHPERCETGELCESVGNKLATSDRPGALKAHGRGCDLNRAASCHFLVRYFTDTNEPDRAKDYRGRSCTLGMKEDCAGPGGGSVRPVNDMGRRPTLNPDDKLRACQGGNIDSCKQLSAYYVSRLQVDGMRTKCNGGDVLMCRLLGLYFAGKNKTDQAIDYLNVACSKHRDPGSCSVIQTIQAAAGSAE